MATKLIELADGTLVEVEAEPGQAQQISGGVAEKIMDASLDKITPILIRTCRPIIAAWEQLNQELDIDQAEVELALSFASEGNIYLAKATTGANLTIKLVLKPRIT